MEDRELPPDLSRLERDLASRRLAELSPALRSRVMGDVRATLRRDRVRGWTPFAIEAAAAALLWINLSWVAVWATETGVWFGDEHGSVAAESRRIQELVPELSAREASRTALVLQAASALDRCRPSPLGLVAWEHSIISERISH